MNVRSLTIVILTILLLRSPAIPLEKNGHGRDFWKWATLTTRHFDLHYPSGMENIAVKAAEIAESSYIRVSNHLRHEMNRIIPVVIYPPGHDPPGCSPSGSQTENCNPEQIRQKDTITVSFNGSYADLQKSITRRMTHVFIYSIARETPWHNAAIRSNRIPFWLKEGIARYLSSGFDVTAEMKLRDIIQGSRFFGTRDLWDRNDGRDDELPAEGQALCYFLVKRFGKETLGELIRDFLDIGFFDDAFRAATGKSAEDLDREWAAFLLDRYKYATPLPETGKSMLKINAPPGIMIPAVSPDGKMIAALFGRQGQEDLLVFDISIGRTTTIQRAKTLLRGSGCHSIKPVAARDNRISWSPDGRIILLAGLVKDRPGLLFIDAATGRIIVSMPLPFSIIKDPALSPDGRFIAFSGIAGSAENIYVFDRRKNTITRVTDDDFSDRFPVITADGVSIIFSTNWNIKDNPAQTGYHIHQIDIKTGRRTELAAGGENNIQPELSSDGKKLLFISDRNGLDSLYIYTFATKNISRFPVQTAAVLNPRWLQGSSSFIFTCRKNQSTIIAMGTADGAVIFDPASREPDLSPASYQESYVDPREYAFHPYQPHVQPGWLQLGSAGTINNSYLCYLQAGLTDYMGRHRLIVGATYVRVPRKNDINASLAYYLRIQRTTLGFGIYRQSNPLAIHSLDEMLDLSPQQSFGIHAMEHYGGYLSIQRWMVKSFNMSINTSVGRYEKEYHQTDWRHDLHMTFGKLSFLAEYNTQQRGLMIPVRGSQFQIIAEHAVDFTGKKSYTRLCIDLRHQFLFSRQFLLFLRGAGATLIGSNHGGFQHYLGGFGSLRGYNLNSISGKNMFLFNTELRFTPVDWNTFGMPWSGGLRNIGIVLFFDAGSAWNGLYRLVDKKTGRLDDLKMDFGAGIRIAASPLLILKLDFAWPFDNKSIRQTNMLFSIGFDY